MKSKIPTEDKSVRITRDAHKMLQDYTKEFPLYKINMLADLAIKKEMIKRMKKNISTAILDRYPDKDVA